MYSLSQSIRRYATAVALAAAAVAVTVCSAPAHAVTGEQCQFLADVGAKAAVYAVTQDEAGFGEFISKLDATVTDPELRGYVIQVLQVSVEAATAGYPPEVIRRELLQQCLPHVSWEQRS